MNRALHVLLAVLLLSSGGAGVSAAAAPNATESKPTGADFVIPVPKPLWFAYQAATRQRDKDRAQLAMTGVFPGLLFTGGVLSPPHRQNSGNCLLRTQDVHLRKSAGFRAVGPKPETVCTHQVDRILHFTQLQYKSAGNWRDIGPVYDDADRNVARMLTEDIEYQCHGTKKTIWRSRTDGYVQDGDQYFSLWVHSNQRSINCGI